MFKVGDRVRLRETLEGYGPEFQKGDEATIVNIYYDHSGAIDYLQVAFAYSNVPANWGEPSQWFERVRQPLVRNLPGWF